ncbi:hypothetical protein ACT29H_06660 [Thermophagus sp. OGC60D27]|uniref:hypothetical protein n=1 Tax=Thermophagus sp. OGC60D27 TaxID=3458415 RepID=UPI0040377388
MIRPIKIFLYFFLILLLIMIIDRGLSHMGISLVPAIWDPPLTAGDPTAQISLNSPPGTKEENDSVSVLTKPSTDNAVVVPEGIKTIYINDSALIAPPQFIQLFTHFCNRAEKAKEQGLLVRILHIGDSQIEADRITGTLRKKFQNRYGGSGPGFIVPFDPQHVNATVRLINKGDWQLSYSYRKNNYPGNLNFGFSAKAAWFKGESASFIVSPIVWKSQKLGNFTRAKLFVTTEKDSLFIRVRDNSTLLSSVVLPPLNDIQTLTIDQIPPEKKVTFEFTSGHSPAFHGLTLDGDYGVAVDNMAMRGRPWPGVRLAEHQLLKSMSDELNIGLFILQFGTNILPTRSDDYHFYYSHFVKELKIFNTLFPDIPVLVIGVQAAAGLSGNEVKPLQRARLISEAQRTAALECHMGFIDLQKAMGGVDAAILWANHKPPLISSDYMHFSRKGAYEIAIKIWNLMEALRTKIYEQ